MFNTGLNWFGVEDLAETWPFLAVSLLLLFSLRGEAVALAGSSCGGDVDGEMPRDNSKCLGKHI